MFQGLWQFILAVANSWAGYTTGGTIVASAWLYYTWRDKPMPRIIGLSLSGLFLLMAFFKAWKEQKSQRDVALEQLRGLRQQVDSLTKSNINGTIDWAVIGSQPNGHSHVGLIASLTNSGAATAINPHSWTLTVRSTDKRSYLGQPNTLLDKNLDFCFPPAKVMRFVRNDALYLKTASVLPMNGATQGFIWFGFDVPKSTIFLPQTVFVLAATSVTGQHVELSITIEELIKRSQEAMFFSGIENPRALDMPCRENTPY